MPVEEWEDYLRAFYARVDTNGDGLIDVSESRGFVLEAMKMWSQVWGTLQVSEEHLTDEDLRNHWNSFLQEYDFNQDG